MKKNQPHFKTSVFWTARIILVFAMTTLALESYADNYDSNQDKKISIDLKNVSLGEFLSVIEKESGYNTFYNNKQGQIVKKINIKATNESVENILKRALEGTGLTYLFTSDNTIVISIEQKEPVKNVTIKGNIIDDSGDPLPGAAVMLKSNLKIGVAADINGHFELNVPETEIGKDALVFSCIGMKTIEMPLDRRTAYFVKMETEETKIENIVVTGYYSLSKERSAGSFTTVSLETLEQKASTSIIERLSGQVPGLSVNFNSSAPDKYLLRGATSINSSREPLIVVDGIPIDITTFENSVSTEDVTSVSVLKDATASSIWGAKAANGVIVITTKRGVFKDKFSASYTGSVQIQGHPDFDYLNYMNASEYVDLAVDVYNPNFNYANELSNYGNITPIERALYNNQINQMSDSELQTYLNKLRNSDNQQQISDLLYRNKVMHHHNVKISGGSDKSAYLLSVDYRNTKPQQIEITDERLIIDLKNDYKVKDWLKLSAGINVTVTNYNSKGTPNVVGMIPYEVLVNDDGSYHSLLHTYYSQESYAYTAAELTVRNMSTYDYKIMDELYKQTTESKGLNTRFNAKVEANIFDGLTFESRFQYQRGNSKKEIIDDAGSFKALNLRASQTANVKNSVSRIPAGAILNQTNSSAYDWTLRNQVLYKKLFGEKHNINALMGTEVRRNYNSTANRIFYGYNTANKQYVKINEADMQAGVSGGQITNPAVDMAVIFKNFGSGILDTDYRYFSLYANGAYDYDNRYALNASVRMDQANLFGTGVRYKPIWSVGALWKISNEKFFKSSLINNLNLRVSQGIAGNTPNSSIGGPFDIVTFGSLTNIFFAQTLSSPSITSPALKNLNWEKTNITNIGVDFGILNNKLSGSIEYYNKNTADLIGKQTIDPTNGFSTINTNIGKMRNRGVEFILNSVNLERKDFSWNTSFNISYNKNIITDIYVTPVINSYVSEHDPQFIQGYPAFSIFSYRYAGLNEEGEPMVYNENEEAVSSSVTDINALEYSGTTQPPVTGGLTNEFSYENLSLSFQITYAFGSKIRKDVALINSSDRLVYINQDPWIQPINKDMINAWKQPGDEATTNTPKWLGMGENRVNHRYYSCADINIVNGSYILLSDISLSYKLPKLYFKRSGIESVTITGQISNPYICLFNDEGIDPRYTSWAAGSERSLRYGAEYMIKLNLNF
jgi:TonB-linked SusC/RagA family outer membrane protein